MLTSIFRICFILSVFLLGFTGQQLGAKEVVQFTHTQSDEEAFLIRRIAEFWKDGDFGIVKRQIIDFLERYPESELKDYFLGIQGDIYLQENNYKKALSSYQQINDYAVVEKTILNKLQCYYELDLYLELSNDGRPYLSSSSADIQGRREELNFLMGEALFRQALQEESLDVKVTLSREARDYYEDLHGSEYSDISEFALAEISGILGEYESASEAYLLLSLKHPDMKEDLLFQVASLQAKFNKPEAAETFRQVREMDGERSEEASFNLLVLLFQNGEFDELISSYEKISLHIPEEFQPTLNFILGKSFFSTDRFQSAQGPMQEYIDSTYTPSDQLKNALLIQMTCAQQINDEELFNRTFEKLDSLFPNDEEIPKALFMHAMILKEQGATSRADEKLKLIKENYHDFGGQESFAFEYGLLAHQNERWHESYRAFKSYVVQFSESSRIDAGWKLFLSSSLSLYKHSDEADENGYSKFDFFMDLQLILSHAEFFTSEEMKDYSLLFSKTAYELDYYSEALRCLQEHLFTVVTVESDPQALAEAHFIAGLCHAELQADSSAFCMHLEEAIALSPELYDSPATHLQLYNAYISLAGFGESGKLPKEAEQQREFIDSAAEHLQVASLSGELTIKDENRLWLANHYYSKVKKHHESPWALESSSHPEISSAIDRASVHYQALLYREEKLTELSADNLHLEHEILKLAKLLEYKGEHGKKLTLLKNLLEQQSEKPELNWMSQKQALYDLATAYEALGQRQKACETFSFIKTSANHFPTSLAYNASLEAARLHFDLLEDSYKNESNEEVLSILNDLKELQIRKNASSEPTHLEAALEYAKIRAQISSPDERDSRYLFFLNRIKDDFNSQEDLVTQDYLMEISRNGEKQHLFDSYMKFIDAEKIRLHAKSMFQQERLGEMEELHETALNLYNEIKNKPNTPRDLCGRIASSIQEINALNAY
ncbi:MAG: hypothetical protein K1060chlam2_00027 [Chlamydiae bacterium]|nr:hypothetical protein [Chlamydiota bacterium]